MRRMRCFIYYWPGLPQLWIRGNWSALVVAVGAAAGLNLALLSSFVWNELIGSDLRTALWAAVGLVWGLAAAWSVIWNCRLAAGGPGDPQADTFGKALEHYLRGNWFQAERALAGLLRKNARDLDARLMLATLLRHTGRFDEAREELERLTRFEGVQKWESEIGREKELLAEARKRSRTPAPQTTTPKVTDPPDEIKHAA